MTCLHKFQNVNQT